MFGIAGKSSIPSFDDGIAMSFEQWTRLMQRFGISAFKLVGDEWPYVVEFHNPKILTSEFNVRVIPEKFDPIPMTLAFRTFVGHMVEGLERIRRVLFFQNDAFTSLARKLPRDEALEIQSVLKQVSAVKTADENGSFIEMMLHFAGSAAIHRAVRLVEGEELPSCSRGEVEDVMVHAMRELPNVPAREVMLRAGIEVLVIRGYEEYTSPKSTFPRYMLHHLKSLTRFLRKENKASASVPTEAPPQQPATASPAAATSGDIVMSHATIDLTTLEPFVREVIDALTPRPAEPDAYLDSIASIMGWRSIGLCPTPGDAKGYEEGDWKKLVEAYGIEREGMTAHSHLFVFPGFTRFHWGFPKTSGDVRAPMACMTEFRSNLRTFYDEAAMCARAVLLRPEELGFYAVPARSLESVKAFIPKPVNVIMSKKEYFEKAEEINDSLEKADSEAEADPAEAKRILTVIYKEMGKPPRQALFDVRVDSSLIERLNYQYTSGSLQLIHMPVSIYTKLKALYADFVKRIAEQKEQTRLERERAERAEKEDPAAAQLIDAIIPVTSIGENMPVVVSVTSTRDETAVVLDPSEPFQQQLNDHNKTIRTLFLKGSEKLREQFNGMMKAEEARVLQYIKPPQVPTGLGNLSAITQELDDAKVKIKLLTEKAAAVPGLTKERDELQQLMKSVDETDPWRDRFEAFLIRVRELDISADHGNRAMVKITDEIVGRLQQELEAITESKNQKAAARVNKTGKVL